MAAITTLMLLQQLSNFAKADTFGSGANQFTIEFVNIGNPSNAADPLTGFGSVPYEFRLAKYAVSQTDLDKATLSGLLHVNGGAWSGLQPAANISWYEAAAFVNWLNTSSGKSAAYNLSWNGSSFQMSLWSSAEAWQLGGENLFRHKDAFYFLPNENEWYKAAYGKSDESGYYLYPTASDTAPNAVTGGTAENTAVFNQLAPAAVNDAGALSSYGASQAANVWKWMEDVYTGENTNTTEDRLIRTGAFDKPEASALLPTWRDFPYSPSIELNNIGFQVASVPEPSTYALLLFSGAASLWALKRRKS